MMKTKECPKCGSKNLKYVPWLGQIWICKECGYRGPLIAEEDD